MNNLVHRQLAVAALSLAMMVLPSCGGGGGGGGGGSAPTSGPTVAVAYQPKQVVLSWSAVEGATHYRVLKNPDGASGFSQIGVDVTGTSYADDLSVHLTDWVNMSYEVEACNSIGCAASAPINTLDSVKAIGYVKAFNTGSVDSFGNAVSLSADGNTLAIGAYFEASIATGVDGNMNDNSVDQAGAVYVYWRNPGTGTWARQGYLKASNTEAYDSFGYSLSLSADGNTLAVGANGESSAAVGVNGSQANGLSQSGAVYVFARSAGAWSQQAYVKASNPGFEDKFGASVALSSDGSTLAVGAIFEDSSATGIGGNGANDSATYSGAVYVFTRSGTGWSQQAYVKASNTGPNDYFGRAVTLSGDGDTLAVGAYGEDSSAMGSFATYNAAFQNDEGGPESGAVYVFHRVGGLWSQQAYVKASNTGAGDLFGSSVSLSTEGNTLAVGALGESSNATGVGGDQTNDNAPTAGAAYLFTRSGTNWSQQAYVKASNSHESDSFGGKVALSGDGHTLAVGAIHQASKATGINGDQADRTYGDAGAVYVYGRNGTTWSQRSFVKASNTEGDRYGSSVSLSADGGVLAVGAEGEDSAAIGVGGDQTDNSLAYAGAVYLY